MTEGYKVNSSFKGMFILTILTCPCPWKIVAHRCAKHMSSAARNADPGGPQVQQWRVLFPRVLWGSREYALPLPRWKNQAVVGFAMSVPSHSDTRTTASFHLRAFLSPLPFLMKHTLCTVVRVPGSGQLDVGFGMTMTMSLAVFVNLSNSCHLYLDPYHRDNNIFVSKINNVLYAKYPV